LVSTKQKPKSYSSGKQGSKQYKAPNNAQAQSAQKAKKEAWRQQLETSATSQQMAEAEAAKKEARRQRQLAAQATAKKRRQTALVRRVAIIAAVAILLAGGVAIYMMNEANKPGELVAMQPSPHIKPDEAHAAYTTDPPTSGPHVPQVPAWTVYTEPITKEVQVHALEDAGVVINYRPDLDKATVDRLAALTKSYSDHAGETQTNFDNHVLMSPYPGLSNAIVLTAWRRIQRFDTFDEAAIKRFIDEYKNHDHHGESGS